MSLIDKIIRSASRPKSFWIAFAIALAAPVLGLPYVLLVNYGLINHSLTGFLFFLVLIVLAFCFIAFYMAGQISGKYKGLRDRSWSELPW
jgi:hypothetical protein